MNPKSESTIVLRPKAYAQAVSSETSRTYPVKKQLKDCLRGSDLTCRVSEFACLFVFHIVTINSCFVVELAKASHEQHER